MSLENTLKLMGFYMDGLILGINTMYMYMLFCFFKLFLMGCIGYGTLLLQRVLSKLEKIRCGYFGE